MTWFRIIINNQPSNNPFRSILEREERIRGKQLWPRLQSKRFPSFRSLIALRCGIA